MVMTPCQLCTVPNQLRSCCKWASKLCLLLRRNSLCFTLKDVLLLFSAPEFLTLKAHISLHIMVCGSHGDRHARRL